MSAGYRKDYQIQRAKLAEMAERYDDMVVAMKEVTKNEEHPLSVEERNLLSVAYKNIVGAKRSSWRALSSIEKNDPDKEALAKRYRKVVENEIDATCKEILELLDRCLISKVIDLPTGSMYDADTAVFYLKMKGDYYRYIAEIASDEMKHSVMEQANEAYQKAFNICQKELESTNPIRLGLALNYSVFQYEIKCDSTEACTLAKAAFEDATEELESLSEDAYRESSLIMGLLSDNLTLWTGQQGDECKEE